MAGAVAVAVAVAVIVILRVATPGLNGKAAKDCTRDEIVAEVIALRPDATSDYVRTNADLATMEGANEAARRAVNALLTAAGSTAAPCPIWTFDHPLWAAPFRALDELRWKLFGVDRHPPVPTDPTA